jgi:hypothetical protein
MYESHFHLLRVLDTSMSEHAPLPLSHMRTIPACDREYGIG